MRITLYPPNGTPLTYHDCALEHDYIGPDIAFTGKNEHGVAQRVVSNLGFMIVGPPKRVPADTSAEETKQ